LYFEVVLRKVARRLILHHLTAPSRETGYS